ncbi:MAG: hypothetical protein ACXW3D_07535 [Caulobacteraceae bacterium]
MRTSVVIAALLAAMSCSAASAGATPATASATASAAAVAVDQLLDIDRTHGQASGQAPGLGQLRATWADDVVAFAVPVPGFSHGPTETAEHVAKALGGETVTLSWSPIRAGVSADNQHGFTFGYAKAAGPDGQSRPYKYLAYWVRRNGEWRVALYKLVPSPEEDVSLEMMPPLLPARPAKPVTDAAVIEAHRKSLADREQAFSDESQRVGLAAAFAAFGAEGAVNVGGEAAFTVGPKNIGASQPEGPGSPLRWSADQGVLVASSGDLGVTWGYLHRNGPTPPGRLAEIPFFTIWGRSTPSSPWLYIAE